MLCGCNPICANAQFKNPPDMLSGQFRTSDYMENLTGRHFNAETKVETVFKGVSHDPSHYGGAHFKGGICKPEGEVIL